MITEQNIIQKWLDFGVDIKHFLDTPKGLLTGEFFQNNTKYWYKNSKLHRDNEPALIDFNNSIQKWYQNGLLHRENYPAILHNDGREYWYQNGLLHRENGPAILEPNIREEWYTKGLLHRINGPARIHTNGLKEYYQYGMLHRLDGPAIIHPDGSQKWYQNGVLHRHNGPAIICPNGTTHWYFNGKETTPQKHHHTTKKGENMNYYFMNYQNEQTLAPPDLKVIIANFEDGLIVWSRKGNTHQVRYALEVNTFTNQNLAAEDFKQSVLHHAACQGLLDD